MVTLAEFDAGNRTVPFFAPGAKEMPARHGLPLSYLAEIVQSSETKS